MTGPSGGEELLPCPFCAVKPERLKNLDFSDSEAFWHPDDVDCIIAGCSIHRAKWAGWNTRALTKATDTAGGGK